MLVSKTRSSRDPGAVPRGQWHFDGCSQLMKVIQMLCTWRENIGFQNESMKGMRAAPRRQWHSRWLSQNMKSNQILCTCRENVGHVTTYWSTFCFVSRLTAFWPPAGGPLDQGVGDAFVVFFFVCQSRQSCEALTSTGKHDLAHWVAKRASMENGENATDPR